VQATGRITVTVDGRPIRVAQQKSGIGEFATVAGRSYLVTFAR
jgi:hypothetical protein